MKNKYGWVVDADEGPVALAGEVDAERVGLVRGWRRGGGWEAWATAQLGREVDRGERRGSRREAGRTGVARTNGQGAGRGGVVTKVKDEVNVGCSRPVGWRTMAGETRKALRGRRLGERRRGRRARLGAGEIKGVAFIPGKNTPGGEKRRSECGSDARGAGYGSGSAARGTATRLTFKTQTGGVS